MLHEKTNNQEDPDRGDKIWKLEHSAFSAESADLKWPPEELEDSELANSLKSTPMPKQSCETTSQESRSTQTSEITIPDGENLTSSPEAPPAKTSAVREIEKELTATAPHSGLKCSESSSSASPTLLSGKTLREQLREGLEKYLPASEWSVIRSTIRSSYQQRNSEQDTDDRDCLLFPTLTASSGRHSRPAGQTRCEKWWREKGLIPLGSQLGTSALASIMGFPSDWFKGLTTYYSKNATIPNPPIPLDASELDTLQVEVSPQHKLPLFSEESSTSIPCLVKQIDKCSSKASPPSKIPPTKQRRKKGDGTGYIYRRTITRKGKQYEEFYYRYRDESGKLRSKYIPQILLNKVEGLESRKLPVADVLSLLGGEEISRGEQFNTNDSEKLPNGDQSDESICLSRGEQATPPSKRRRNSGYGAGYIECKPIKRNGKQYKQYWYQGDR